MTRVIVWCHAAQPQRLHHLHPDPLAMPTMTSQMTTKEHTFKRAKAYSSNSSKLNSNDGTSKYMSTSEDAPDALDEEPMPPSAKPRFLTSERGTGRERWATFMVCIVVGVVLWVALFTKLLQVKGKQKKMTSEMDGEGLWLKPRAIHTQPFCPRANYWPKLPRKYLSTWYIPRTYLNSRTRIPATTREPEYGQYVTPPSPL